MKFTGLSTQFLCLLFRYSKLLIKFRETRQEIGGGQGSIRFLRNMRRSLAKQSWKRYDRFIDNIRTSMYEEVPEESEQLKLIYSMYADTDNSLGDIVRYLNEHQIKNLQDAETKKQAKEAGVDPAMLSTVSSRGRIAIANASSSSRQAKLCRIEEVDFFNLEQEHVDFTVTVNGIDVVRMTEEEMRRFRKLEKGRCAAPSFFVTIL